MDTIELEAQTRDKGAKSKDLLKEKFIPAEYYGRGVENKSLQMDYQTFRRAFNKAGTNTIIDLKIDGKAHKVLVHDVQYNPVADTFTHVDFINVKMDQEIHTKIPLEFVGTSIAVKDFSGTLMSHLEEVEVKCLPKDLVHSIEVSIEPLVDFHTNIRVKDLIVPPGMTILNEPEDVVVTAMAPRVEEEEAPTESAPVEGAAPAEGESKPE